VTTDPAVAPVAPVLVLVADDHPMVRQGLADLLAGDSGVRLVAAARDGHEAVALAQTHHPDVVLMDLEMPGMDGVAATGALRAASPAARVVVLTSFGEQDRILAALDAGAIGYLLKDAEPEEILRGVYAAARGHSPFSPQAAGTLLSSRTPAAPGMPLPSAAAGPAPVDVALSPREREVLGLVAEGLPSKSIGRRLGISEKTVKAHLTRIFQALGVADRTSAALWAHRHGLTGG